MEYVVPVLIYNWRSVLVLDLCFREFHWTANEGFVVVVRVISVDQQLAMQYLLIQKNVSQIVYW